MKKFIFGVVLGLVSVVSFAQTVQSNSTEKHQHTKKEIHEARKSCKETIGKPQADRRHHKAMMRCMESKGFKNYKTPNGEMPV